MEHLNSKETVLTQNHIRQPFVLGRAWFYLSWGATTFLITISVTSLIFAYALPHLLGALLCPYLYVYTGVMTLTLPLFEFNCGGGLGVGLSEEQARRVGDAFLNKRDTIVISRTRI